MATLSPSMGEPIVPTAEDVAIAKEASHMLAAHPKHLSGVRFQILGDRNRAEKLTLPPVAVRLLLDILTEMAAGHALTLIPCMLS